MPLDHYETRGRSGLRVSPFALGAMNFGQDPPGAGASADVGEPTESDWPVIDAVARIAEELGVSSAGVALAWLRAREGHVVPLIGARRVKHLKDNLAALDVTSPPRNSPHWTRCQRRPWATRPR